MNRKFLKKPSDLENLLTDFDSESIHDVVERHPMIIPSYYANLIDPNDPNDPIRRLSVPDIKELDNSGDYDTSGESENTKLSGLQHKYKATALVLTTNACYMYCRHCFRKRMVGFSKEEIAKRKQDAIQYITKNEEINNVLLTGGDSMCLTNNQIRSYLKGLSEIDHLDFIRFGTRVPVVYPMRIYEDEELLSILSEYTKKKKLYIVTQFNHPKELTSEALKAVKALHDIDIDVLNQTVLLKGVNDNPDILSELLSKLTSYGMSPYYVFQCRPVKAVKASFQLPLLEAFDIVSETRKRLNGVSKRVRFSMSHPRGKIELVGRSGEDFVFKFHQAKSDEDHDRVFLRKLEPTHKWLDMNLNPID